jgi:hypothetical protein
MKTPFEASSLAFRLLFLCLWPWTTRLASLLFLRHVLMDWLSRVLDFYRDHGNHQLGSRACPALGSNQCCCAGDIIFRSYRLSIKFLTSFLTHIKVPTLEKQLQTDTTPVNSHPPKNSLHQFIKTSVNPSLIINQTYSEPNLCRCRNQITR